MSEFHVTLSPGIVRSLDSAILISVDEPEDATRVEIALYEADSWSDGVTRVREDRRPNDLIARFTGNIIDGQFRVSRTRPGRGRRGAPTVKFRFDGSEDEHEFRIPGHRRENEAGVLEIIARISGRIGRRRRSHTTPSPVFVRQFGNRRPILTYTMPGNDGYFRAARVWWGQHADALFTEGSIERILQFVRDAPSERNYGRWGELNIVSHGNRWNWFAKLFAGRTGSNNPYPLDATALDELGSDQRLLPRPTSAELDNRSKVVLRGCVMGNNQTLLDEVRELFGDDVVLYAPKHLEAYSYRGTNATEYFARQLFVYRRIARVPNRRTVENLLAREFPEVERAEIRRLLAGTRGLDWKHGVERMGPFTIVLQPWTGPAPSRADAEEYVRNLYEEMPLDRRFGADFGDWRWTIRTRRFGRGSNRGYRVVGRGVRVRLELRQKMRDGDGRLIVPDLTDSSHYGRSPAW